MSAFQAADVLRQAAVMAGRAPSIHNSQPWRWRAGAQTLDLFLARDRVPPGPDAQACFTVLSCGAALHHARVQLAAQGWNAVVQRMPDAADPDHLARIRVTGRIPVEPVAILLARAAEIRRTDRRDRPSPPLDTDKLRCVGMAVRLEGAALRTVRADQVYQLATAADLARGAIAEEPGWGADLVDWAGSDRTGVDWPGGERAGVERAFAAGVPVTPLRRAYGAAPSRPGTLLIRETHDRAAVFAVLHGPGDERPDWLRAGEALSAGWLTATRLDVAVLPLSAVVAVPAARRIVQRLTGGSDHPYLVLRFAAADDGPQPPGRTPRLPAGTVVESL